MGNAFRTGPDTGAPHGRDVTVRDRMIEESGECHTITNGLSVSPHVQSAIASCAQVLYALRVLRAHRLCDSALHTICRSVVVAKLIYASSAWEGFANATDRNKIQSFINKSKRNGYCSPDLPDFSNL